MIGLLIFTAAECRQIRDYFTRNLINFFIDSDPNSNPYSKTNPKSNPNLHLGLK